ncbi:hypothetical protein KCU64_g4405, partial [Aureobasidium melanogenum]
MFISVLLSTQHNTTTIQHKTFLSTTRYQVPETSMQEYFNSNADVQMDDSVPDTSSNAIIFDDMDENNIQQLSPEMSFQSCSSMHDPFFTSEPSAEVAGDELIYNLPDGFSAQRPGYSTYDYATQDPGPGTHFTDLHPSAQTPTSYPHGSSAHLFQQTPLNYPTPASIIPAAKPEAQPPKTPTKSSKKTRKTKRGNQNKQKTEFVCHYCGRISECASNLEEHILTHTGVRDYSCTYVNDKGETCHKRFARPWGLTRHCKEVHKVEVKVTKRGGMVILGPFLGKGSPKESKKNKKKTSLLDSPPSSSTATEDASPLAPHTTPPTVDHIRIITSGPEGPCLCATCDRAFAEGHELMEHNHRVHGLVFSSYCPCDLCIEWFTPLTSFDNLSTFSNIYGSINDNMDVEAPQDDTRIDPQLSTPGTDNSGGDIAMTDACVSPIAESSPISVNADADTPSPSPSSIASDSSIDEESPNFTPLPAHPDVDARSAAWAKIAENDIVTYNADGFAIHSCPPVSPTTFYGLMGLDYNNMTDAQRRDYFGGA